MPLPIFKSSRIRTINRTLRLTILVHKFCGTEFPVLWSGLIEGHKFLCPRLLCATLVKSRIFFFRNVSMFNFTLYFAWLTWLTSQIVHLGGKLNTFRFNTFMVTHVFVLFSKRSKRRTKYGAG